MRRKKHGIGHRHGEGIHIDYHAHASKIKHWSPSFKVLLAVESIILCIIMDKPLISLSIILMMSFLTVGLGKLSPLKYLSILLIPMTFVLLGTFTIAIDFSRQPIGEYNLHLGLFYIITSKARLTTCGFLILKVTAAITALQMLMLSTPASEVVHVLRRAHVPKLITELMNIIYRYIFILMEVFLRMKDSAEARLGYSDFKTSCRTFGGIAGNLLIVSLKKASIYYDAMEARCYDGEMLLYGEEKLTTIWQIVVLIAYTIILISIRFLYK